MAEPKITIRRKAVPGEENPLADSGAEGKEWVDNLDNPQEENTDPEDSDTDGPFGSSSNTDRANEEGVAGMNKELGINEKQDSDDPPELDIDKELRKNNQS